MTQFGVPTSPIQHFYVPGDPCEVINEFLRLCTDDPSKAAQYLAERSDLPTKKIAAFIAAAQSDDDEALDEVCGVEVRRTDEEIYEAAKQAADRIWIGRKDPDEPGYADIRAQMEIDYHGIAIESDFHWGYLNGVLSALRWVHGAGWMFLDT